MSSETLKIWTSIGMIGLQIVCVTLGAGSGHGGESADGCRQVQSTVSCSKAVAETGSSCWYYADLTAKPRGVALVLHGLNLRPAKMRSIIDELTAVQIDALKVSYYGHGQNYPRTGKLDAKESRLEALKGVSYQLWNQETYQAYCLARRRSDHFGVPLFLVGYSLGGLLGPDLFVSRDDVRFERMVLFAPALDLRAILYAGKILSWFPRLIIPSLASNSYREHSGLPIAAYKALFAALQHFKNNLTLKLNVPTLVFIDRQDELVSYKGLMQFARQHQLDGWSFHRIEKGNIGLKESMHHLLIDPGSVGVDIWRKIKQALIQHLVP